MTPPTDPAPHVSSRDEKEVHTTEPTPPARGRPRRWPTAAEKHRQARARGRQRVQLVAQLLVAVRNAELDDRQLHHVAQFGDDAALLTALIAYYRARYWMRPQREEMPNVD